MHETGEKAVGRCRKEEQVKGGGDDHVPNGDFPGNVIQCGYITFLDYHLSTGGGRGTKGECSGQT